MKTISSASRSLSFASLLLCACIAGLVACPGSQRSLTDSPDGLEAIRLPEPVTAGGKPLMEVLEARESRREFKGEMLPVQVLSNLMWAAFGVSRPETGKRTAPSAMNWQEVDVYVATAEGLYLYDAESHSLEPILARDVRAKTGRMIQPFVAEAPVNLVYVADFSRMTLASKLLSDDEKLLFSSVSAGCIIQNVYLYCASEGLSTVVRGLVDKSELAEVMGLDEDQRIILAQTVGYPSE